LSSGHPHPFVAVGPVFPASSGELLHPILCGGILLRRHLYKAGICDFAFTNDKTFGLQKDGKMIEQRLYACLAQTLFKKLDSRALKSAMRL
jgi:hypothetical protein